LPRQTAQQTAPAAEEWKSPEALSFLIRRFCPDGIRSGAIRPGPGHVWGGYRLESTPPVPAEGMSLVAYVHEHRLAAERAGQEVWNFVAGGRISAEPVVHENLAFFGSHDGYVYAVNVKDGSLAWRFLAAPADKRHVAFGQIESAWPVFNVVLHEGRLYFAAGRHQELDGGIHVYSLDPKTGAAHWHVKSIRGLSTEKHTPPNLGGKGTSSANTYVLNDRIAVRDGKVLLRAGNPVPYAEVALVEDIQNPKDMIVNPETLVPPWRGPAK
jgi:outer membrane protein assembly factor BamB